MASDQSKTPSSWSADGRFLLYHSVEGTYNTDLWIVPMAGDHTPSVVLKTPVREGYAVFSPDDHWVAYMSAESGQMEVYVRPFVPPGSADTSAGAVAGRLVSTAGGIHPVWRPDGKELYYLNPAGAMMAAPITVTGSTLAPGVPVVLFPTASTAEHGYGTTAAVRRGPRWPLPHQYRAGQRQRADHIAAELESRGEAITRSPQAVNSIYAKIARTDCALRHALRL